MKKLLASLLAASLLTCIAVGSFAAPGDKDKKPTKTTKGTTTAAAMKAHGKMDNAKGHGKVSKTTAKKGHGKMANAKAHGKVTKPAAVK